MKEEEEHKTGFAAECETLCLITPCKGLDEDIAYPWFTVGDLEAFVALFSDNVVTIVTMMFALHDLPDIVYGNDPLHAEYKAEFVKITNDRIVPGLAFAILMGNVWYAWMATKLAQHEKRTNVCAQPFGVNTPAAFVFIWNVCLPAMFKEAGKGSSPKDMAENVWMVACSANFIGGVIETLGCIIAEPIRQNMAMAAIMGPIAGIGMMWLGVAPVIDLFEEPTIGLPALFFAWSGFFSGVKYCKGWLPFAVIAMVVSSAFQWMGAGRWPGHTVDDMSDAMDDASEYLGENGLNFGGLAGLGDIGDYMAVVFPIALNNFIGTMMVVESAHLAGDAFPLAESMVSDGLTTIVASIFGCVLPTTVYIGHPFYKSVGGTRGYALLNGFLLFIMCSCGLMPCIQAMISVVGAHAILACIGLLIVSQSVELTVDRHYPALMVAMMPIICDWAKATFLNDSKHMMGLLNLGLGGGILISMMFTQILCDLIDRRYLKAAAMSTACVFFSLFGIIHPNNTIWWDGELLRDGDAVEQGEATIATYLKIKDSTGAEVTDAWVVDKSGNFRQLHYCEGWRFCIGYTTMVVFCLLHWWLQKNDLGVDPPCYDSSFNLESIKDEKLKAKLELRSSSNLEAEMAVVKRDPGYVDDAGDVETANTADSGLDQFEE